MNIVKLFKTHLTKWNMTETLYNHACESVKKQIGENAHILKLTKDNLPCYSIKDFREIWASAEGLQKHNLIWQVRCCLLIKCIYFHLYFFIWTQIMFCILVQVMYGFFDLFTHIPRIRHIEISWMKKMNIMYSKAPIFNRNTREKGCFEKIVKLARRDVLKVLNKRQ